MLKVPDLDALSRKDLQSLGKVLGHLREYCRARAELLETEAAEDPTEAAESTRACHERLEELYRSLPRWAHWKPGPSILDPFSAQGKEVIKRSGELAKRLGCEDIDTVHMLMAVLSVGVVLPGVDHDVLRRELEVFVGRGGEPVDEAYFTHDTKDSITAAFEEARAADDLLVGPMHILCGLLRVRNCVAARTMVHHGITLEWVRKALRS